jgi:hypothetical protein
VFASPWVELRKPVDSAGVSGTEALEAIGMYLDNLIITMRLEAETYKANVRPRDDQLGQRYVRKFT